MNYLLPTHIDKWIILPENTAQQLFFPCKHLLQSAITKMRLVYLGPDGTNFNTMHLTMSVYADIFSYFTNSKKKKNKPQNKTKKNTG